MIIDFDQEPPEYATPCTIHRASDGEIFVRPEDVCIVDTDTGDYTAMSVGADGLPYVSEAGTGVEKHTGSFGCPVYVVTADGERFPTEEDGA